MMIAKNFKTIVIALLILLNLLFIGIYFKMDSNSVKQTKSDVTEVEQLVDDKIKNSIDNTDSVTADSKFSSTISKGTSVEQIKQDAQVIHQLMLQAEQDAQETEMSKNNARSDANEIEAMKYKK